MQSRMPDRTIGEERNVELHPDHKNTGPVLTRREYIKATGATALALAVAGCGGGGPGAVTGTGPTYGKGSVAGFVYSRVGSPPILGYTASPPAGYAAAAGVTITVAGADAPTVTNADGSFTLTGVPTGIRTLNVGSGAGSTKFPLTIFPNATVQVGDPPVTRMAAVTTAKQAAIASGIILETSDIMATQQPLPAGVSLTPIFALANGMKNPPAPIALAAPAWLIYVDQFPSARFGHDVTLFQVDAAGGAVTSQTADSWPTVNRAAYYGDVTENLASPDLVQAALRSPRSLTRRSLLGSVALTDRPPATTRDHESDCGAAQTYVLIVQGDNRGDFAADPPRIASSLFGGTSPFPAAAQIVQFNALKHAPDARSALHAAFSQIIALPQSCDYFVLYITSHGTVERLAGGPEGVTLLEVLPDSNLTGVLPDSSGIGDAAYQTFTPAELDFSPCKACHIVIFVDTCHSGWWIDALQPSLSTFTGKEVAILTASDKPHQSAATGPGSSQVTANGRDFIIHEGGAFTDALLIAQQYGAFTGRLYSALSQGYAFLVPIVNAINELACYHGNCSPRELQIHHQNPQMWQRTLVPGEVCGTGSVTTTFK